MGKCGGFPNPSLGSFVHSVEHLSGRGVGSLTFPCLVAVAAGVCREWDGGRVTLAYADAATSEDQVRRDSNDPVVAVRTAARDGLLVYRGFDEDTGFEVVVAGQEIALPAATAAATVRRLRGLAESTEMTLVELRADGTYVLQAGDVRVQVPGTDFDSWLRNYAAIDGLSTPGFPVRLAGLDDDGMYVLDVSGMQVRVSDADFQSWVRGYRAGLAGDGKQHVGEDRIGEIEKLLTEPSLRDQCRIVLLGLMYGGPERVSAEDLRERIGGLQGVRKKPTKKTVVDALGFGAFMADALCERMIAAFGMSWSVAVAGHEPVVAEPGERLPEMPALVRLRMIVAAAQEGWLRYVDLPSPNRARWRPSYDLVVGDRKHTVSVETLRGWLAGLSAFHGVDHVPGESGL